MSRLLVLFLFAGISQALATLWTVPDAIRITVEDGRLVYAYNRKALTLDRIPAKLVEEIGKFGKRMDFEIIITEDVPLAAMLEVERLVKESGMEGSVYFYLSKPDKAQSRPGEPPAGRKEILYSISLARVDRLETGR